MLHYVDGGSKHLSYKNHEIITYNGCAQFFHEIVYMIDCYSEEQNTFMREIDGKSYGAI